MGKYFKYYKTRQEAESVENIEVPVITYCEENRKVTYVKDPGDIFRGGYYITADNEQYQYGK